MMDIHLAMRLYLFPHRYQLRRRLGDTGPISGSQVETELSNEYENSLQLGFPLLPKTSIAIVQSETWNSPAPILRRLVWKQECQSRMEERFTRTSLEKHLAVLTVVGRVRSWDQLSG